MIDEPEAEQPSIFGLREIVSIILRWRYLLIASVIVGTIGAAVVATTTRPVYRASATLLIESQDILTTVVASPLANYAEERIAKIRQQILNRANLLALIRRNRLYAQESRTLPAENIMAMLRQAISVDLVSAASGNTSQRGADSTIAFNIAFTNNDPNAAYHVTEQLTEMFVAEDKRLRGEQVTGAATFFVRRANELRDRLVAMEAKRREIEARYAGALPEQVAVSAQSVSSLRAEISRMDAEGQGIMQQNGLLATRSQDLAPPPPSPARTELARAQGEFSRLSAIYSDEHPDVVAARAVVARAQQAVDREPPIPQVNSQLEAEVAAGRSRIAMLSRRRGELVGAVGRIERLVSLAPQASYELNNLERDYDNLKQQYQAIRDKQLDAQVAANLQAEGKGERFSVVEPPTLPLEPVSPKRTRLVMMGAAAGLAFGIALILAWEVTMLPIHGPGMIAQRTGAAPLAAIPVMKFGPIPSLLTRRQRALAWLLRRVPI